MLILTYLRSIHDTTILQLMNQITDTPRPLPLPSSPFPPSVTGTVGIMGKVQRSVDPAAGAVDPIVKLLEVTIENDAGMTRSGTRK